jgi:hypothetical protein
VSPADARAVLVDYMAEFWDNESDPRYPGAGVMEALNTLTADHETISECVMQGLDTRLPNTGIHGALAHLRTALMRLNVRPDVGICLQSRYDGLKLIGAASVPVGAASVPVDRLNNRFSYLGFDIHWPKQ